METILGADLTEQAADGVGRPGWAHPRVLLRMLHASSWCPLCLENPRDGGAWWAAVYGVAQSDLAAAAGEGGV